MKILNHMLDVNSKHHTKTMSIALLIAFTLIILIVNHHEIRSLEDKLNTYIAHELLKDQYNQDVIIDLRNYNNQQDTINQSFNDRIHDNYTQIVLYSTVARQNAIDIDEISNEGVNQRISEIIEDVKRIERIVE